MLRVPCKRAVACKRVTHEVTIVGGASRVSTRTMNNTIKRGRVSVVVPYRQIMKAGKDLANCTKKVSGGVSLLGLRRASVDYLFVPGGKATLWGSN